MHIENLYKNQDILMFKECYATEKIHGSSAHISWDTSRDEKLMFFAGGTDHLSFSKLFDKEELTKKFEEMNYPNAVIFGEAYGGKMQGMKETYGPDLKFIGFEVKLGDLWCDVPHSDYLCKLLGIEFVYYERGPATVEWLDTERDATSPQAWRNLQVSKPREGIVIHPIIELRKNNGDRIICKHKGAAFSETKTPRVVGEDTQLIADAEKIADEWVTMMRLKHIVQDIPNLGTEHIAEVIVRMIEDVVREGKNEVVDSKMLHKVIGRRTALMVKELLNKRLNGQED
jgi:hypothetical protein